MMVRHFWCYTGGGVMDFGIDDDTESCCTCDGTNVGSVLMMVFDTALVMTLFTTEEELALLC